MLRSSNIHRRKGFNATPCGKRVFQNWSASSMSNIPSSPTNYDGPNTKEALNSQRHNVSIVRKAHTKKANTAETPPTASLYSLARKQTVKNQRTYSRNPLIPVYSPCPCPSFFSGFSVIFFCLLCKHADTGLRTYHRRKRKR
jgi:hypothetical protein